MAQSIGPGGGDATAPRGGSEESGRSRPERGRAKLVIDASEASELGHNGRADAYQAGTGQTASLGPQAPLLPRQKRHHGSLGGSRQQSTSRL